MKKVCEELLEQVCMIVFLCWLQSEDLEGHIKLLIANLL
jgi:hypothetical protein